MPIHANVIRANFSRAIEICVAAMQAGQVPCLIGDPGIGKSAMHKIVASTLGFTNYDHKKDVLIGSTLDPTDVGGLPTVDPEHGVRRWPIPAIRAACAEPRCLLIDELATSSAPVQAALLRFILEGVAGDDSKHPGTMLMVATNPEEQSPAGIPISAPMMGRLVFIHLRPDAEEVLGFLATLGGTDKKATDFEKHLRSEANDFVSTANVMPDLLQIDVPAEAVGGNVPWGAPRAWERALRIRAVLGPKADAKTKRDATAGCVGNNLAAAFAAVLDSRDVLPSVNDILKDPVKAPVPGDKPEEKNHQIGAASLVQAVAEKDTWAAWAYAARLAPEIRMAVARILLPKRDTPAREKSPHGDVGHKARIEVLRAIRK
jgi:MoxR-like ATPase